MAVMPMFPLGQPVLPGTMVPLHVFEQRYRQLIRDILADDTNPPQFGVVLILRGSEVGGGESRADVGATVRVIGIDVTNDGRYALIGIGVERIRVSAWLPDDPYPRADVERWPDVDGPPVDGYRIAAAQQLVSEIQRAAAEFGEVGDPGGFDLGTHAQSIAGAEGAHGRVSDDPSVALYQLASLAPIGPADRQRLLEAAGPSERLGVLEEALADAMAVWDFRRT